LLHYRHRIYYVSGNHEYYYGDARKWFSEFGRHGIEVLNNKIDGHSMNLTEAMQNCSAKSSRILLSHNPASVLTFSAEDLEKVDVVLSGHTHAGQYYVLVPLISWLLPYFHGLYDIGHGKLLGAPMKMLWMSEIWVVTLTKST
uniref:Metallophos domain-containing protein n=1 Tax=Heligmosomoides polygyrus TaxID=6339 RepID=A0A183FFY9_HELPZ